jgi:hypothetical protein
MSIRVVDRMHYINILKKELILRARFVHVQVQLKVHNRYYVIWNVLKAIQSEKMKESYVCT